MSGLWYTNAFHINSFWNKQPPQFKGQAGARATEVAFQCIYFLRFRVKNINRTYTTVQGAAHGKPGISLCLHVLQCAVHQNPTSAATPAEYIVEATPSTGNRRAGRFIFLKYCSLYRSICSSINRELAPWAQQQARSIKRIKEMY